MTTTPLKPWSQIVRLHPDVERGDTSIASYAIDLGALVTGDPNIPRVYREARPFFAATYLTKGLRDLLAEVLARLAGESGDRVLQLHSPFGGGKSHTLAALYHAALNPEALRLLPEAGSLPNPGPVRVAVFDGEKFDVQGGVVNGQRVQTLWGALAAWLGRYDLLAYHDERRIAPGGDKIAELLTGQPALILLDEVLKYLVSGRAEVMKLPVGDSTLGEQTQNFLQTLSTEVARSTHAVLVYSLQASAREALGNQALLNILDHLVSRVDAKREPVRGDEVLSVLQRRLLDQPPPLETATAVSREFATQITKMRASRAASERERRNAEDQRYTLEDRLKRAYPFHPALIDVMWERWSALPEFQRTRGALRFLSQCLHVLKRDGQAGLLLGPGDIPLEDDSVRRAFFTEVGQRESFQAAMQSDFIGPNARVRRIDQRLADEHPLLSNVRPAMRLATAILAYSFGGRLRPDEAGGEPVGTGATEQELLEAIVGPDLDSLTAEGVLKQLREQCLYLHYDGTHYVFKTTPNITYLIEQANVSSEEVMEYIEKDLRQRLRGRINAILWPADSSAIPDKETRFLLAYLPLDFATQSSQRQQTAAADYFTKHGGEPRHFRNGLALVLPEPRQVELLRQAARNLIAVTRVLENRDRHNLTSSQVRQINDRKKDEERAFEAAMRDLYQRIWLPKFEGTKLEIESIAITGRPLSVTGLHEKLVELLTVVTPPRVFTSLQPRKLAELMKLGTNESETPALNIAQIIDAFFRTPGFPRLSDESVIRDAIVSGVAAGSFGYVASSQLNQDSLKEKGGYLAKTNQVQIGAGMTAAEIDTASGFILVPEAIETPDLHTAEDNRSAEPEIGFEPTGTGPTWVVSPTPDSSGHYWSTPQPEAGADIQPFANRKIYFTMRVNRQQIYAITNALANLAREAGTIHITIQADRPTTADDLWLRNAVFEPLEEADVLVEINNPPLE